MEALEGLISFLIHRDGANGSIKALTKRKRTLRRIFVCK